MELFCTVFTGNIFGSVCRIIDGIIFYSIYSKYIWMYLRNYSTICLVLNTPFDNNNWIQIFLQQSFLLANLFYLFWSKYQHFPSVLGQYWSVFGQYWSVFGQYLASIGQYLVIIWPVLVSIWAGTCKPRHPLAVSPEPLALSFFSQPEHDTNIFVCIEFKAIV